MDNQTIQGPQDLLDLIRDDVITEVRRTIAQAKCALKMIREKEEQTGKTAVGERDIGQRVRVTEVLTGTVVAEYDSADVRSDRDLENIVPREQYFFLGDGSLEEALDVIDEEFRHASRSVEVEVAVCDLLGEALLLPEKQFAEFVGESPEDVRLARLYRAWENLHIDAPVEACAA